MKEDKYTLVMFDPDRHYLYWLLTDIPAGALAAGTLITESNQIAEYIPPVPTESDPCLYAVLMLFRQPGPQHTSEIARFYNKEHGLKSKHCLGHCIHRLTLMIPLFILVFMSRSGFDIAQFKAFHRLKMSAVSWFRVCYDLHEAHRRLKQMKEANSSIIEPTTYTKSSWNSQSRQRTTNAKLRFALYTLRENRLLIKIFLKESRTVGQSTRIIQKEKSPSLCGSSTRRLKVL